MFPWPDTCALKIYRKARGIVGTCRALFTYSINVNKPMEGCLPFPESYSSWYEGCQLLSPMSGQLPSFVVKVPGAFDIAIIDDSEAHDWKHFDKDGDGWWRAQMNTGDTTNRLRLVAKLKENENSYSNLLEFLVSYAQNIIQFVDKSICANKVIINQYLINGFM